jgi:hypothetical protein
MRLTTSHGPAHVHMFDNGYSSDPSEGHRVPSSGISKHRKRIGICMFCRELHVSIGISAGMGLTPSRGPGPGRMIGDRCPSRRDKARRLPPFVHVPGPFSPTLWPFALPYCLQERPSTHLLCSPVACSVSILPGRPLRTIFDFEMKRLLPTSAPLSLPFCGPPSPPNSRCLPLFRKV